MKGQKVWTEFVDSDGVVWGSSIVSASAAKRIVKSYEIAGVEVQAVIESEVRMAA